MKATAIVAALALAAGALGVLAQDAGNPPAGKKDAPAAVENSRSPIPIFAALDPNGDAVIDEKEIANAVAALKALDKNGDGKLTRDEYLQPPVLRRGSPERGPEEVKEPVKPPPKEPVAPGGDPEPQAPPSLPP